MKGEWKPTGLLLGIVIFSSFMIGFSGVFLDFGERYEQPLYYTPVSGDTTTQLQFNNETFNQISEVNERLEDLQNKLGASGEGEFNPLTIFDILNFLYFYISSVFLTIPNMINDLALQASLSLGIFIPNWFLTVIIIAPIIIIIGVIISWATKRST